MSLPSLPKPSLDTRLRPPDLHAPLDLAQYQAQVPDGANMAGFLATALMSELAKAGVDLTHDFGPYVPFRYYPVADMQALRMAAAQRLFPNDPPRAALFKLGLTAIERYRSSTVGENLFRGQFDDPHMLANVLGLAYRIGHSHAHVTIVERARRSYRLRFEQIFSFWDCLEVGTITGALKMCRHEARILLRAESPHAGEMLVAW